jgi:hypothetical protein
LLAVEVVQEEAVVLADYEALRPQLEEVDL